MNDRASTSPTTGMYGHLARLLGRPGTVAPTGARMTVLLVAVLLAIAGTAGTRLFLNQSAALPHDAVFRVDGTVVTKQQFTQRVALVEFLYGVTKPSEPAKVNEFNRVVAKAVAVSLIVEKAARQRDIVIADKTASDQLEKLIRDSGMDRRAFIQELGSRGLSERDILNEIKFQKANARLFAQVTKAVPPTTDAAAKRYFDDHRDEMATPESRGLVNIVVASKDQARRIAHLAKAGGNFAALVEQYSLDESTRSTGGSLGMVQAAQLDTGYANAAFAARKGEVFGPVQTSHGWNVGRVTDVQRSAPLSFAQLKDALKVKLDDEATTEVWNAFLTDRIRDAQVVYAPDYRPSDPDALPEPPSAE
jgi:parvulin-like peptidyl-prolyl isomerase